MTNLPDWIMAACAAGSLIVAIIALVKTSATSSQLKNLTSQVSVLTTELNKVSSSMKDSKVKQVNKGGDSNKFIGGSYNG